MHTRLPTEPVRVRRTLPPLRMDRDVLDRFVAKARALVPPGDVDTAVADDTVRVVRRGGDPAGYRVELGDDGGVATLVATGPTVWAYATTAMLAEFLDVYARAPKVERPPSLRHVNFFSAGFTLAASLVIAFDRGLTVGLTTALVFGIVWFAFDFALSEARDAFAAPVVASVAFDLRAGRERSRPVMTPALWRAAIVATVVLWLGVGYGVVAAIVPHLPKH